MLYVSQKGFVAPLLLLVVLLVAVGIGIYSLQSKNSNTTLVSNENPAPTTTPASQSADLIRQIIGDLKSGQSPTSSPIPSENTFKSYVDAGLGFQVQYSSSVTLLPDNQQTYDERNGGFDFAGNFASTYGYAPPTLIKGLIAKPDGLQDLSESPFTMWVFDNPNGLSPSSWYNSYWYYPFVWGEYQPRKSAEGPDEEASISGQIVSYTNLDYRPMNPKFIYLPYYGKMYLFQIMTPNTGDPDIGNQILNSFKLLN